MKVKFVARLREKNDGNNAKKRITLGMAFDKEGEGEGGGKGEEDEEGEGEGEGDGKEDVDGKDHVRQVLSVLVRDM